MAGEGVEDGGAAAFSGRVENYSWVVEGGDKVWQDFGCIAADVRGF